MSTEYHKALASWGHGEEDNVVINVWKREEPELRPGRLTTAQDPWGLALGNSASATICNWSQKELSQFVSNSDRSLSIRPTFQLFSDSDLTRSGTRPFVDCRCPVSGNIASIYACSWPCKPQRRACSLAIWYCAVHSKGDIGEIIIESCMLYSTLYLMLNWAFCMKFPPQPNV